jgi:hypothetical protein
MLASKDLLMIHIPKTGGTSLEEFLRANVPFAFFPGLRGALEVYPKPGGWDNFGLHDHVTIQEASPKLEALFGWTPSTFRKIVAGIRNPYHHAASVYFHQRNAVIQGQKGLPTALYSLPTMSFKDFLKSNMLLVPFEKFFEVDGGDPPTLHLIRFEHLVDDSTNLVKSLGFPNHGSFPHLRINPHPSAATIYDGEMEQIVYDHYRRTFDSGFYKRFQGISLKAR